MQYTPADDTRPRRQASHLRAEFAARGRPLSLAACLDIVAQAYGHPAWAALRRRIGHGAASPLDDEADGASVTARRAVQCAALEAAGLDPAEALDVAEAVRFTARRYGRTSLSAARVTFLDLTCTQLGKMTDDQTKLLAELLERERVMNVHRKGANLDPKGFESFMRTVPESISAVARHFVDVPHEVTFGLILFAGTLSRTHEEARIWVSTLQELWRRLDGRTVGIGHFAEAFAPGIPTQEAVAELWARRSAGERTTGMPRFPHVIGEGEIGLMVNGMRRAPYVVTVARDGFDAFMEHHERIFAQAPADPSEDEESNIGLQVELLKENVNLKDGDPELLRSAGILLWLAMVHVRRGQGVRDAVSNALEAVVEEGPDGPRPRGRAYVTMTVSDTLKVRTSISDAFEDRTRIFWD